MAARPDSSYGNASTYCRTGTIVATGNVKDEILMLTSKTFTRDDTIVNRSLPYRQKGALYLNGSKDGAPVKLTVEPGVSLGFEENAGSAMTIGSGDTRQGILEAVGTADAPIALTSAKATKAAGDWTDASGPNFTGDAHASAKSAPAFSNAQAPSTTKMESIGPRSTSHGAPPRRPPLSAWGRLYAHCVACAIAEATYTCQNGGAA